MQSYFPEPGYIHDTVAFLKSYLEKIVTGGIQKEQAERTHYNSIFSKSETGNIRIPHYLYPFVCRHKGRRPFLASLLLDNRPYEQYSYDRVKILLDNNQYLRSCFVEYYFNSSDQRAIFKKAGAYPDGLDMITQQAVEPVIGTYLYYTLIHFDEVIRTLADVVHNLYIVVECEHKEFLIKNPEFIRSFQSGINMEKLKILAKTKDTPLFSMSLLDSDIISAKIDNPGFFLLGCKCGNVLDTRHKYLSANPYTFAEAIGSSVRYDIYRALLNQSPMTRSELEIKLNTSRGSLTHNLDVMRDKGLLIVDHQTGLTQYYRLDPEYIRAVAALILDDVRLL